MPFLTTKAADPLKSDGENYCIDTFIRQTMGKEPYLSFSRVNESPVQWVQLLNALEQQAELPAWSVLSPTKIQLQKCGKCSREFCSTISYRRHLRLHRRKLNLDKDSSTKIRGLLQAFWDKLCVEEAMEIISLDDVSLEGVSGSSIIKALTSFIRKSGYTSLPNSYMKSGSVLLDIVQGRPLRFPISSQELFNILDNASEKTFLCAGTAESLQKFVFNGDAGKIGLEMRNLVACTSFLVEQKLVKACLADKDAEALRYQKLLVEEEEAAQKRQAALLEKKRQKKLRQKDQRAKELVNGKDDDSPEESSPSPPSSIPADDYDSILEALEIPSNATTSRKPSQLVNVEKDTYKYQENRYPDYGADQNGYPDLGAYQNFEHSTLHRGSRRQVINSHWQAPKSLRNLNGFHTSHKYQAPKPVTSQKRASSRNSHTFVNSTKVWTPKPKSESQEGISKSRLLADEPKLPNQERKLLIGSISVPIGNHIIQGQDGNFGGASETCASGLSAAGENGNCERPVKGDGNQGTSNRSAIILWGHINQHDDGGQLHIHNRSVASKVGGVLGNDSDVDHLACVVESSSNGCEDESDSSCLGAGHQGGLKFSSHVAEAFLSLRWKEAITVDHVELVLFPEEPPGQPKAQDVNNEAVLSSTVGERKPEKGRKVNYIQKQKSGF